MIGNALERDSSKWSHPPYPLVRKGASRNAARKASGRVQSSAWVSHAKPHAGKTGERNNTSNKEWPHLGPKQLSLSRIQADAKS